MLTGKYDRTNPLKLNKDLNYVLVYQDNDMKANSMFSILSNCFKSHNVVRYSKHTDCLSMFSLSDVNKSILVCLLSEYNSIMNDIPTYVSCVLIENKDYTKDNVDDTIDYDLIDAIDSNGILFINSLNTSIISSIKKEYPFNTVLDSVEEISDIFENNILCDGYVGDTFLGTSDVYILNFNPIMSVHPLYTYLTNSIIKLVTMGSTVVCSVDWVPLFVPVLNDVLSDKIGTSVYDNGSNNV